MVTFKWQKHRRDTGHLIHMTKRKDFNAHIVKVPGNKYRAFYKKGEILQSFSRKTVEQCKSDIEYIYNNLYLNS